MTNINYKFIDIFVRIVIFTFYTFILFPYIKIFNISTDTQPYALVFGIILLLIFITHIRQMPLEIILLLILLLMSILMIFAGEINFTAIRSVSNYASLFIISLSTYLSLKYLKIFPLYILKLAIIIWFIVGFVQTFIDNNFMVFLVGRGYDSLDTGRGVVGLAPEPTFYGLMCIFLLLLTMMQRDKLVFFQVLLYIQIILFSKSSMSILFLFILWFYYVLIYPRVFKIIVPITVLVFIVLYFESSYIDAINMSDYYNLRIYRIITIFITDPFLIIKLDESINDRIFHLYFSVYGFLNNYLFPNGFSSWPIYLENIIPYYSEEAWGLSISDRIMSGYGAAIYELGFMGLIVPVSITSSIYKCFKNNKKKMWLNIFYINTIMLSAIQLALPIISFMVGYMLYLYNINNNAEENNK